MAAEDLELRENSPGLVREKSRALDTVRDTRVAVSAPPIQGPDKPGPDDRIAGLDGLRALAVAAVVVFHLHPASLPGGFVGVDAFLVLSGFLMVRMIVNDFDRERYTAGRFLLRRFRRLAPALAVVTVTTWIGASLVFLPERMGDAWLSGLLANLQVSNIHFWKSLNYFGPAAESEPFLHAWSLAVEAQYYLALPLLVAVLAALGMRNRRGLAASLLAGVVFSLGLAIYFADWRGQTTGAFFLLPTRAWELLVGGLLALSPPLLVRWPKAWSATALLVVLFTAFAFDSDSAFPGLSAIPVVVAVSVLIALARSDADALPGILTWRLVSGLGLISYSVYLWHWPVIVLLRTWTVQQTSLLIVCASLAVTLALSLASYRFIEQRRTTWRWSAATLAFLAVGTTVAVVLASDRASRLADGPAAHWLAQTGPSAQPRMDAAYDFGGCFQDLGSADALPPRCLPQTPSEAEGGILLIGDSHAAHLRPGLAAAFPERRLWQANVAGCRPLIGKRTAAGDVCARGSDQALAATPAAVTILGGRWQADELPALESTLRHLISNGHKVVLMGATIEYPDALPSLIVRLGLADSIGETPVGAAEALTRLVQPDAAGLDGSMRATAEATGASFIPIREILCPGPCRVLAAPGVPMQWDYGHFTPEGSKVVIDDIADRLRALLDAPR